MKDATIAELFSKAAGKCSICKTDLFVEDVKIGEMAHMIAKKKDGTRGRIPFEGDLNSYANLILLCPNHHTIVDGNEAEYPITRLRSIKADHESWVKLSLADHSKRHVDVAGLNALMHFLPFTQLRSFLEFLPNTFYVKLIEAASALEAFPVDNPQCRPFDDPTLEECYSSFVARFNALMRATEGVSFATHSYVFPHNGEAIMVLNPELTYQEKAALRKEVSDAVGALLPVYLRFMDYLRSNYRDVNITAYR